MHFIQPFRIIELNVRARDADVYPCQACPQDSDRPARVITLVVTLDGCTSKSLARILLQYTKKHNDVLGVSRLLWLYLTRIHINIASAYFTTAEQKEEWRS
jgi:hypothetical protein